MSLLVCHWLHFKKLRVTSIKSDSLKHFADLVQYHTMSALLGLKKTGKTVLFLTLLLYSIFADNLPAQCFSPL